MSEARVVLITGASSGLGRAVARRLSERGFIVYGTSRDPSRADPIPGVEMLPLDVRETGSVGECLQALLSREGRLDVLVNNAGYALVGSLEDASLDQVREIFETNLFGAVRMVKAALPVMRRQGSGQIIDISSAMALARLPFVGYYAATKCAVEGFSESLWHELQPLNIRVSVVAPGFFRSNIESSSVEAETQTDDYAPWRDRALQTFRRKLRGGPDPDRVVSCVLRILDSAKPSLRYYVGRDAKVLPVLRRLLPPSLYLRVIRWYLGLGPGVGADRRG